ncbi:unnamed protein product [Didymodactylos carnosus]|uniref:EF-hand domain-containing protein n=1 Tax=Didymodactylos carnosus TaxID=1234261 RepID=A0A814Q487_9BILA|nr:unnamed protein product [Didymodactylos carnosus]CAF1194921.1 unnamed protein product [Didymodactylos carnosus]CAF3879118.1 unnamed protein product [Didymodactylos carnosus]CAF4005154.1 unnamed protein product [Didymodactylos carnosus]
MTAESNNSIYHLPRYTLPYDRQMQGEEENDEGVSTFDTATVYPENMDLNELENFGEQHVQDGTLSAMLRRVGIEDAHKFINDFREVAREEVKQELEAGVVPAPAAVSSEVSGYGGLAQFHKIAYTFPAEVVRQEVQTQPDQELEGRSSSRGGGGLGNLVKVTMERQNPTYESLAYQLEGMYGGIQREHPEKAPSTKDDGLISNAKQVYNLFRGKTDTIGSAPGENGLLNSQFYSLFKTFDKNGDGKITKEDIELYLRGMGIGFVSPYLAKSLFAAVDSNHSGTLDFVDLMTLMGLITALYTGVDKTKKQQQK